ncbi:alpha/beta-hydrolase [Tilletiaria anomala UBC 951]|uniref:Alpha/beta-hydrolase n=1 Tax=Tilletiaria anomala (strain ATCC 24038 / CBS 436.72 / UBC 951) TaxID=1037660 RepID=A0A066VES1_TILAU|nr:alpha/beta-hydrolase [Tilletiaria anomala UBC 951]KDN37254.1 alpha/beta-hydrolase [Tilletiaria anomala UBC 951]
MPAGKVRRCTAVLLCVAATAFLCPPSWRTAHFPFPSQWTSPASLSSAVAPLPPEGDVDVGTLSLGDIHWHQCPEDIDSDKFECGRLSAPLNYLNSTTDRRRASIYVTRYKARVAEHPQELTRREDVLGTIVLNPGGPGGSGVDFMTTPRPVANNLTFSDLFNQLTKGRYDYLSFDPRGVGRTWPRANCWKSPADSCVNNMVRASQGMYGSIKGGGDAHLGELLAEMELVSQVCAQNEETRDTLQYIGTTATARDMRLLYTAVGDTGLNYWGFSYGSTLGATFADMFPSEVRRLVIDGVMQPAYYYQGLWNDTFINTDGVLDGFYDECAKAGDECALAKGLGSRAGLKKSHHQHLVDTIRGKVERLYERLGQKPVVVANATHPGLLTWSDLHDTIFHALYAPVSWNALAQDLQRLIDGDPVPFFEKHGLKPCETGAITHRKPSSAEATVAITCGDTGRRFVQRPTVKYWKVFLKQMFRLSHHFGATFSESIQCHGSWQIHSNEPWLGDFTSPTAHPLLMIGNSYDPVTPYANAVVMSSLFPNSSAVLRRGYGHCSISQKSRCIEHIVGDYFLDGTLPPNGTVCDVDSWDQPLFGTKPSQYMQQQEVEALHEGVAGQLLTHAAADIAAFQRGRRLLGV